MIKNGKAIHVKMEIEDYKIVQDYFKKNQHVTLSGVVRQLLLNHIEKKTNKEEKF